MIRPVTAVAIAGAAVFTISCLLMMNTMFKRRKAILVRARSPVLAYLQGLALLIVADTMILDETLRLENRHLPCFVTAYSVYIFVPLSSNMLALRSVNLNSLLLPNSNKLYDIKLTTRCNSAFICAFSGLRRS
jgi:hypothetical protein